MISDCTLAPLVPDWVVIQAWMVFIAYRSGGIREQIVNAARVRAMIHQQLFAPWYAQGAPLVPQRIDPRSGIIVRRYGAEEEMEGEPCNFWNG